MNNYTERRKCKRIELEKKKYKEIVTPHIARFRNKQWDFSNPLSLEWNIVAVKNLSAGGIMFDYYKKCRYYYMELGIDSLMDLEIDVSESKPTISCIGRVVRIEDAHTNSMFRIAIEFKKIIEQEKEMTNRIVEKVSV